MRPIALLCLALLVSEAFASPTIQVGDLALRHDIQRLADYGVITGPVSTWPLAWAPILADVTSYDAGETVPPEIADALARVRARGDWESRTGEIHLKTRAAASRNTAAIRSYEATPREEAELSAGLSWIGNRLSIDLHATVVDEASDDEHVRADGSEVGIAVGNWTVAASMLDRWWGPGWDSSLVLSSNARPIPAFTLDRRNTDAFETKWLRWIGEWDMSLIAGELEKERAVPNARFLGFRFNFRPMPALEIGISRTAQWCGDGRPCDIDIFFDLLVGRDNIGSDDITLENEPGNQTAALDFRWRARAFGRPFAVYGQFMAEDEAGGFPSRYIAQLGAEGAGYVRAKWSYRWYAEAASTSCDFWKSEELFNCAYNHGIYQTGYRYRGRVIGHAIDNDARTITLGLILVDADDNSWQGYVRGGRLNRGGPPDSANSLTPVPQDILNLEIIHKRVFRYGRVEIGLGYDDFGGESGLPGSNDARAFIQWRTDY